MLVAAFSLPAQETGQTIIKRETIDRDFYAAGQVVHHIGPVNGDATIVGQRLTVDGTVTGDVLSAGEFVTINGDVLDDIRVAGRQVQVNGTVGDHMVAVGETVTLGPSAKVGGWVWLAGQQVEILGKVGKELKVAGHKVIIAGEVGGPVTISAERVRILGDAIIHGPWAWDFLLGILLAAVYLLMVVSGGLTSVSYISDVALHRLFKKSEAGKGVMVLVLLGAFVLLRWCNSSPCWAVL